MAVVPGENNSSEDIFFYIVRYISKGRRKNGVMDAGLGDCTAEALRSQSKEFLIKKYSDLWELCVSVVKYCFGCGSAALGQSEKRRRDPGKGLVRSCSKSELRIFQARKAEFLISWVASPARGGSIAGPVLAEREGAQGQLRFASESDSPESHSPQKRSRDSKNLSIILVGVFAN
jgi:hypothetical protein